jgi:hypothetical protein
MNRPGESGDSVCCQARDHQLRRSAPQSSTFNSPECPASRSGLAGQPSRLSRGRLVAEADGNRTRRRRGAPSTGFEDRRSESPCFPGRRPQSRSGWSGGRSIPVRHHWPSPIPGRMFPRCSHHTTRMRIRGALATADVERRIMSPRGSSSRDSGTVLTWASEPNRTRADPTELQPELQPRPPFQPGAAGSGDGSWEAGRATVRACRTATAACSSDTCPGSLWRESGR